jgi:hypothetical protein
LEIQKQAFEYALYMNERQSMKLKTEESLSTASVVVDKNERHYHYLDKNERLSRDVEEAFLENPGFDL